MEVKELVSLTYDELMLKYRGFKEELLQLRFQHATGQLEKTHRISEVKKNLARVLTVLGTKQPPVKPAKPKAEKPAAKLKTKKSKSAREAAKKGK